MAKEERWGGLHEDRWAHFRGMLRYMLTLQTPEGLPVVCAETWFRECLEDLHSLNYINNATAAGIYQWALHDEQLECSENMHMLTAIIDQSYRIMVGAFSRGYHPDWLCVQPSPALGTPAFPAWDRQGRRVV